MLSMDLKEFFEVKMNRNLKENADAISDLSGVFQFEIGDGIWNLDLDQSDRKIVTGEHSDPDCTIKMTAENFEKMLHRKLNVPMAILTGKIKITGDKGMALKLGELFA